MNPRRLFGTSIATLSFLAALASCGESTVSTDDEQTGQAPLVFAPRAATAAECPDGGVVLDYGGDEDGDGLLDPDEVEGGHPVCNGAEGPTGGSGSDGTDGSDPTAALISLADEPAGTSCAEGGTRVDAGVDTDGDGVLDPGEVTSSTYLCDGAEGEQGLSGDAGADGTTALVVLATEPAGINCPYGGTAINSGTDLDADGLLDPEEVSSTEYICQNPVGTVALVSIAEEPIGTNCPDGGTVIQTGADSDGDGVLDPAEVTDTQYVCDGPVGLRGSSGSSGANALVELTAEPPGDNCSAGGTLVEVGIDLDGDGVLDPDEITDSDYVCGSAAAPEILDGSFTVTSAIDLAQIYGVTRITGDLIIDAPGMSSFALPNLVEVGGNFYVQHLDSLDQISGLDALTTVGGGLGLTDNSGLGNGVSLPALSSVGGGIGVAANSELGALLAPLLESTGSSVGIIGNAALSQVDLGLLSTTNPVRLSGVPLLTSLDLGSLETASTVDIASTGLTDLSGFGGLTTTPLLMIRDNPSLLSLSGLGNLDTADDIYIQDNALLNDVTALVDVSAIAGTLKISGNPSLVECDAEALADAIDRANIGTVIITNNNDPCVPVPDACVNQAPPLGCTNDCNQPAGYLCEHRVYTGNFTISSDSDLNVAATYNVIDGDLTYRTYMAASFDLPVLTEVTGDFLVDGTSSGFGTGLTRIDGLNNLTTVGGTLRIGYVSRNRYLEYLGGFDQLSSVGGDLQIDGDNNLLTITGFGSLTQLTGGDLEIKDGLVLEELSAFANLQGVSGSLLVEGHHVLANITGFANLVNVGQDFWWYGNDGLLAIPDLSQLTTIGGSLILSGNDLLGDLNGLDIVDSVGSNFTIRDNVALPTCAAEALRDSIGVADIGGTVTISGNDDGGSCDP